MPTTLPRRFAALLLLLALPLAAAEPPDALVKQIASYDFGQSRAQIHARYAEYIEQYPRVLEKRQRSAA